jgi:cephalosporin-C deacetylase-like acetyl esterase
LHSYDKTDLKPAVESADESSPYWRTEKVTFQAAYGEERVIARLYLPKGFAPPYQVAVYFPGSDAFAARNAEELQDDTFKFLVRSGRALLFPSYKGTLERGPGAFYYLLGQPNRWTEMNLQWSKDLGRSLDYLETRKDVDMGRVAFCGLSLGAAVGPRLIAVEPRIKTAVLVSAGLLQNVPAEVDSWNFAPHVKIPVLMLNGREDFVFPVETSQIPLFQLLGTPAQDKQHVLFEGGHVNLITRPELMKQVLDWLDKYLGPVKSQS